VKKFVIFNSRYASRREGRGFDGKGLGLGLGLRRGEKGWVWA
jgi:hypothetical protein